MRGLDLSQFKSLLVQPTLSAMGVSSQAAVNLLTGTALAESGLTYIAQIGGPALGLFQMEPATHDDCWANWLRYQPDLSAEILRLSGLVAQPPATTTIWNLRYACAMARVKYLRAPASLPSASDAAGLSAYHKQFYNTPLGAADPAQNVDLFQQAIDA